MPLFGRTEPLAVAERALEDAAAGRGGTLVVTGEAGIGKSALARTLAAQAEERGARVGFGRAWEVGDAPPYWPWSQAVRELGLDLDELLGSSSGEMASAQRIVAFDRLVRAVCGVCAIGDAPVVVILDDLHAADVASLELALAFARAASRKRALLVVTSRENELVERREIGDLVGKLAREGRVIPLRRLGADDTATWLSNVGFAGDASEVHRLSEGNPLFIEEAVRLGVDLFATAAAGGVAVVLAEHLARITAPTREVLSVASVLGREGTLVDVAALAGVAIDDVERAVREGHTAGVSSRVGSGAFVFSHVLLRDSLYESLPASRREALHARAADGIEALGGPPALVARHLLAAGEAVDVHRVVRTVCRAAELAVARHAADSAAVLITSTRARLVGRLSEATTLMLDLAEVDARMSTSPSDEARAKCVDCAARAKRQGLAVEQARAALTYGRELLSGRVDGVMISLLEDALAVVPVEERSLRAQLLSRLAAALTPAMSDEAVVAAKGHAQAALAIAREQNDVPTLLHTLFWCSHALIYRVPLAERVDLLGELASLAREHGADLVLANLGIHALSLLESGRPVAARRAAEEYDQLMETLPLPGLKWKATALRATLAGLEGRLDEARSLAEELRSIGRTAPPVAVSWAFLELALCVCLRDADRLGKVERELVEILKGRPVLRPWAACVYALLGRREEALAYLQPVASLSRGPTALLAQAQAAVFLESAALAEDYYEALLREEPFARFFWGGTVFPLGPVSRILGELALLRGDHERAREHFDTAIAECREMQAVPFLALAEQARSRVAAMATTPAASRRAPKAETSTSVTLTRDGDVWLVSASATAPFRLKHAKGVEYLDHLVRNPGREVYVLALAGAGEGPEDGGAILDDKAKQAYRSRVEDLEEQLDEAERHGDRARASRAREELEAVAEQLASAVGLGGRDRRAASNVERARVNVQRRLKDAIRRIGEHDAALARYLDATVRTGTYCVYRPV